MTEQLDWVPSHVDVAVPSAARPQDNPHRFAADRALAHRFLAAQPNAKNARVVYVDYAAVAVEDSRLILRDNELADLTRPAEVLGAPDTRRLLHFDQPIGVLMVGVFHFAFPDKDPEGSVRRYRDAPAVSHFITSTMPDEMSGPFAPADDPDRAGILAGVGRKP